MAAKIMTQVVTIDEIRVHPNAEKLEIALVKGWSCVVKKGEYKAGDLCVYFQPDTILPKTWTDKFGVTNYCSEKPQGMRIRSAKIRGCVSLGLLVKPEDASWEVGRDVAEFYGAEKYEPPFVSGQEDMESEHALFIKYTDIENMRNYPHIFNDGETVVVTEKIHGESVRCGIIEGKRMSGSHTHRRKEPEAGTEAKSRYWFPWSIPEVKEMLEHWEKSIKLLFCLEKILVRFRI